MIETLTSELWEELVEELVEYVVVFGSAFILLWIVFRPLIKHRKIQPVQRAGPRQYLDEVLWAAIASVGATILGLSLIWTENVSPLIDATTAPWWVGAAVLFGMIVVQDTWFYWIHRWMHANKWVYRNIHLVHHRSQDTTPLTSQRFHPIELFLITAPYAFFPMGVLLAEPFYFAGFAISLLNNLYGHCGFELLPTFWERVPVLRHKTTSLHHNLHHDRVRGNYALYFTWWDRLMGTEFADYAERRDELNARIRARSRTAAGPEGTAAGPDGPDELEAATGADDRQLA